METLQYEVHKAQIPPQPKKKPIKVMSPHIRVEYNGVQRIALLDSGSTNCCIDASLRNTIPPENIHDCKAIVNAVNAKFEVTELLSY